MLTRKHLHNAINIFTLYYNVGDIAETLPFPTVNTCGDWPSESKLHTQIYFVLLDVVVTVGGSADGGRDDKMFNFLVCNNKL
jgi:hypothetical protein